MLSLVDFNLQSAAGNWMVVDDGVMGGRSAGSFTLSPEGFAVFAGTVSLDNNGGFSSVRGYVAAQLSGHTHFLIRLKGDGKTYRLRVRSDIRTPYSYEAVFTTNGQWQTLKIAFTEMQPVYRGQQLNRPNFSGEQLAEIGFLIGNKKAESFQLQVSSIAAQ